MSKHYGKGSDESNPFYPDEKMYEGKDQSIVSPHGSVFDLDVQRSNMMDERLASAREPRGRFNNDLESPKSKG